MFKNLVKLVLTKTDILFIREAKEKLQPTVEYKLLSNTANLSARLACNKFIIVFLNVHFPFHIGL